jgi:hypothetical protein
MPGAVRRAPATLKYHGRLCEPAFFVGACDSACAEPAGSAGPEVLT